MGRGDKRWIDGEYANRRVDWQEVTLRRIAEAGLQGVKFAELRKRVEHLISTTKLTDFIDTLWYEGRVQKFYEGKIIRGTDKLLD